MISKIKIIKTLPGLLFVLFGIYLVLPPPRELPPLPQSLRSTEPGDTWQIPGISAYYTDLSRQEVMEFYRKNFSRSSFLQLPLITYRLNHPPEYARETIRGTLQSTYYEEVTHPLRESLYVNGYEWASDPFTKVESREKNKLFIEGKEYRGKVTIIVRDSSPLVRLMVAALLVLTLTLLFKESKQIYKEWRGNI